jgi:hypothetical protein
MKMNYTGFTAQAIVQGNRPTATLVGIRPRYGWDTEKGRSTDVVEGFALDVVSPSTRYNKITVAVPLAGWAQGSVTDEAIETIAQNGSTFPHVKFDGLKVSEFTKKDSRIISLTAEASKAMLCDEAGNPLK